MPTSLTRCRPLCSPDARLALAVAAGATLASIVARRLSLPAFRYAILAVTIGGSASLLARAAIRLLF